MTNQPTDPPYAALKPSKRKPEPRPHPYRALDTTPPDVTEGIIYPPYSKGYTRRSRDDA